MNRLLIQFVKQRHAQSEQVELQHHQEPEGHIHPDFRHMAWFRRSGSENHSIRS